MEMSGKIHTLTALTLAKNFRTHSIGGSFASGVDLTLVQKRKISHPCQKQMQPRKARL
jgi:hypothetical protein